MYQKLKKILIKNVFIFSGIHQVDLPVPPNTRVSSPTLSQQRLVSPDRRRSSRHSIRHDDHNTNEITLPNVEPIAPEHVERAAEWIPVSAVSLIFSSDLPVLYFSHILVYVGIVKCG